MKWIFVTFFIASYQASATLITPDLVRLGCRQEIMKMASKGRKNILAPILSNDLAEELVDEPSRMIKKISQMEEAGLLEGKTNSIPWSDSYWPFNQGALGQRYNDPEFSGGGWKEASDYVTHNTPQKLIADKKFELLSPSEKYDAILGLQDFPLTASSWQTGAKYFASYGRVESWMGLCHGWAPASMMMKEPRKKVVIKNQQGEFPLYPSDIKAFATLLWAEGGFKTRFIGGRCNSQRPGVDRNGRVTEQNCLDNNPGTWHLSVVNQIGVSKRSFIMDASSGYQVWNHPVFSYQYTYYNPKTGKDAHDFRAGSVDVSGWSQDPRRKFRSPETRSIVGIRMNVEYAIENSPNTEENQDTLTATAVYDYDLELNHQGEIIGGEWYTDVHPDFLWVPAKDAFPSTFGDRHQRIDLGAVSPAVRQAAAINASSGVPFGAIVEYLVGRSAR